MAAIEVYKGTSYAGMPSYYDTEHFDMATFFSTSAHFTIIDSYSSIGGRYKGDPIADTVWTSDADLGEDNDWLVIQCETQHSQLTTLGYTGLPKWQCKFQFVTNGKNLADVSDPTGVKYPKNHGTDNLLVHRFAPYGGWDLATATQDFNPASPPASGDVSTQNHNGDGGNHSAQPVRWIQIHADGALMRLARYNDGAKQFYQVMLVIGDVIPVDIIHMPMPRCAMGNGYGSPDHLMGETANGRFIPAGIYETNTNNYSTTESQGGGIAFWDHNEALVEEPYSMDEKDHWNLHAINSFPPTPKLELFPVMPVPYSTGGFWFSWPYVRKGYTIGTMLYDSKQWMSVGHGFGPLFAWDGSSDIY